jgi:hypothetical protein
MGAGHQHAAGIGVGAEGATGPPGPGTVQ